MSARNACLADCAPVVVVNGPPEETPTRHGDCRDNCPIADGGFCDRHQITKTAQYVRLCREKESYWAAWEKGEGPKQRRDGLPPRTALAWNLAKSLKEFGADKCKTVSHAEYARRLTICAACELRHPTLNRCKLCGCMLSLKAKGRVWKCPIGRWDTAADRRWVATIRSRLALQWSQAYMRGDDDPDYSFPAPWRYVRTAELTAATIALLPRLPRDLAGVAAIPRSGMLPASIIASHLHLPLFECTRANGIRGLSYGMRGHTFRREDILNGPLLIVDDTVYSGFAMRTARNNMAENKRRTHYAAIFVRPSKADIVDFYADALPSPHLLEWNLWSSGMTCGLTANPAFHGGVATDLDGVLCEDFLRDGDDTRLGDERYRRALVEARPLVTAGLYPIPLIVTYRLERFRAETEDWLRRNRILYDKLVMHPAERFKDRDFALPQLKIDAYRESKCALFVESCPRQADLIHEHTGRRVLCPADGVIRQ